MIFYPDLSLILRLWVSYLYFNSCIGCDSGSKERSRSPDHSHDHEAERERERKRDKKRDWGDNDREKDRYCDHDRSQVRAQDRERQIATKCLEDQPGAMTENGTRGNRC